MNLSITGMTDTDGGKTKEEKENFETFLYYIPPIEVLFHSFCFRFLSSRQGRSLLWTTLLLWTVLQAQKYFHVSYVSIFF